MRRWLSLLILLAAPVAAQDSYISALPEDASISGTEWIWCEDAAFTVDSRCEIADIISAAGGAVLTFKTINAPSGTDPVADSTTDTLNVTCSGGLTCTGDSATDTVDLVVGNVATATALAANGANCSSGNYPLGVDASGAVESCTADDDLPDADEVTESMLKAVDSPADEECLTYEFTVGDFEWQSCGAGGGGDSISVNSSAAADANFLDGDIDWTLVGASTPDDITATVACTGCIDITDLASDSVGEAELKAVNSPTDEDLVTYESTTGDFEYHVAPLFHGVSVYNSAVQSFTSGAMTAVTYDTESYDTDGFHSTSSNTDRITIPTGFGGYYKVTCQVGWASNATGNRQQGIFKTGTGGTLMSFSQVVAINGSITVPPPLQKTILLAAADYIVCGGLQGSGGNLNTTASGETYSFAAELVGR